MQTWTTTTYAVDPGDPTVLVNDDGKVYALRRVEVTHDDESWAVFGERRNRDGSKPGRSVYAERLYGDEAFAAAERLVRS